jgi:molecular chaperone Hsp33
MTNHAPMENLLTPFMLEGSHVRGRVVRLGDVAATILSRYDYPAPVVKLLGELLATASLLSANLKQEGIFTIQIRGGKVIPLIVVDAAYGGMLRGYAEVSDEAKATINAMQNPTPGTLVGEGAYLAITLDPGAGMQRYQGIVGLEGDSITDALMGYFAQSEQLDVMLKLAVSTNALHSASGFLIERMPGEGEATDESWRYAQAMVATVTHEELLSPLLDAPTLLYRLFHEDGVWVYDAIPQTVGCRCSRARIEQLLKGMDAADRVHMIVDGYASVHCQFCNKTERFTPDELGIHVDK